MTDVNAELGDALKCAEAIHDHDLSKQAEMQVYLTSAFVKTLDNPADAIRDTR